MQKMCNAKHQLLHMGEMVFVQCLLSKEFWWGSFKKTKKKNRVALTSGDLELNTWLPFHSLKKLC